MTNGRGDVVKIERSIELQMKTEILKGRWVPLRVVNDVHKLPVARVRLFFFSSLLYTWLLHYRPLRRRCGRAGSKARKSSPLCIFYFNSSSFFSENKEMK